MQLPKMKVQYVIIRRPLIYVDVYGYLISNLLEVSVIIILSPTSTLYILSYHLLTLLFYFLYLFCPSILCESVWFYIVEACVWKLIVYEYLKMKSRRLVSYYTELTAPYFGAFPNPWIRMSNVISFVFNDLW